MSTKQTQKEAVFSAVSSVLKENGIDIKEGTDVSPLMTREFRAQVNSVLVEGFKKGTIELEKEFNDSELKAYVSGLQSNWLRKDKRLNGGVSYVAKNPGSRAGSKDDSVQAMRALLKTNLSDAERAEVQMHLDARLKEIEVSKPKKVVVNYDALPDSLKKFGKQ